MHVVSPRRFLRQVRPISLPAAVVSTLVLVTNPALAQRWNVETGVTVTGTASSNPDLAPRGEEKGDVWIDFNPWFSLIGTGEGGRLRASGSGNLGASLRVSLRDQPEFSLRPSGQLAATLEAIDNFFFIDARALVYSTLDNPFQPTTDPLSPENTTTSYQAGVTPYIRGRLFSQFDYEVRSDNSWTAEGSDRGQYSGVHSVRIDRAPQPLGGAFSFVEQTLSSDIEGQSLLVTDTARLSLRYAPTSYLAVGARMGAERYNYTLTANDWQRFYGAELSWKPNDRTSLEGYWEDRVFGNSWQVAFNYRRPQAAFNVLSARVLSSTPQQFLTFPGLTNLISLLNSAFLTRIPDPVQRQRAVIEFLSRTQLPQQLLTPTVIYSNRFIVQETNSASAVFYGTRNSLAFSLFSTITDDRFGISEELPDVSKTRQRGAEIAFSRQLTPVTSVTTSASWSFTENQLTATQETTQTQLRLEGTRRLGMRTDATFGARYQWITSTVTNDAIEAALYFTLSHRF